MMSLMPADGVLQHVVGMGEGLILRHVVAEHVEQLVVEDDDQRVDVGLELRDAVVGCLEPARPLEVEGLGNHAHGEDAHFARHAGNDRCRARARAAAHAGGDEEHVGAVDGLLDAVDRLFGRGLARFRLGPGAEAGGAELDQVVGGRAVERLRVGVGADEVHALNALLDHVLDRVAAATPHADHLDLRAHAELFDHFDCHV